jgi:hypothetical protein
MVARIALALRRATDPEIVATSFAAAGIVPFNPVLVMKNLPITCPPEVKHASASTVSTRLNINGQLLTLPSIIAAMDKSPPQPDTLLEEDEEELAPSATLGEQVLCLEEGDDEDDEPIEVKKNPELTPCAHELVVREWTARNRSVREMAREALRTSGQGVTKKRNPQHGKKKKVAVDEGEDSHDSEVSNDLDDVICLGSMDLPLPVRKRSWAEMGIE